MAAIIENMSEFEFNNIINEFEKFYPDIDPISIDTDLLQDMLENIVEQNKSIQNKTNTDINVNAIDFNKKNIFDKNIIDKNIMMADEIIPEMSVPTNLIYLKGRINSIPVNIMVDTGASCCFTYKSIITKCGIEHLIDTQSKIMIQGAHGIKASLGTIWFLEIDLDISNGKEQWVSIPITIEVNDDTDIIKTNNVIDTEMENKISKMKEIVDSNNKLFDIKKIEQIEKDYTDKKEEQKKNNLEIILGINFLKSYGANIDFSTRTLTLNNSIKIKFK